MSDSRRWTRRTVCQLAGSLVLALTGTAKIAASRSAAPTADRIRSSESASVDGAGAVPSRSSAETVGRRGTIDPRGLEVYRGVVDRIVDETYVVILLEEDGAVVDELVEPRDALPPVAESDRVIVILEDGELRSVIPLSKAG